MKSSRLTLIFGLIVAALVAFTVYDYKKSVQQEEMKSEESKILRFKPTEIQKLEIVSGNGSIVLEQAPENRWKLVEPIKDDTDEQAMQTFLAALDGEKSFSTVVEGGDLTLARFGLDRPTNRLKVTAKDGRVEEVKIGSEKAYDSNLYAQIGDEPRVLLVSSGWDVQLNKSANDLRDKRPFRAKLTGDVVHLEIRNGAGGPKEPRRELVFDKDEKGWKLTKGGDGYPIVSEPVAAYIEQVKAIRGLTVLSEDANTKGELAKNGLAQPSLEIVLGGKEPGSKFVLKAAAAPAQKSASPEAGNVAVLGSDVPQIFGVYATAIDALRKKPEDFYDRKLPFRFQVADVARIKVDAAREGGIHFDFTKKQSGWALTDTKESPSLQKGAESSKSSEALGSQLDVMLTKMAELEAVRFMPPPANGQKTLPMKGESKILLYKASGERVFEMDWGAPITEKGSEERPEVTYVPVRTNLVDRAIGVPEASMKALSLDQAFAKPEPEKK